MPLLNFFIIPFVFDAVIAASGVVFNLIAQDLGATPFDLGMLGCVWGGSYATFCFIVGHSSHRLPLRGTMTAAIGCFLAAVSIAHLAREPWHLCFCTFLSGLGCAMFWPLFEQLLHDADAAAHASKMTRFNMGWTSGLAAGMAASGFLKEMGSAVAINAIAASAAVLGVYFAWATRRGLERSSEVVVDTADATPKPEAPMAVAAHFLWMAWLANVMLYAAYGSVSSIFPKLARELAYPDRAIGLLLSLIVAGQAAAFWPLCRSSWWHYRLAPLLATQLVNMGALALIALSNSYVGFGVAMLLLGLGRAMTYASSLHYSLADPAKRGRNAGIHEMLIGVAMVTGPLLGGQCAEWIALRAAFWMGVVLVGVSMVGQVGIYVRSRRGA